MRRCERFSLYIINIDGLNDTICTLTVDALYAWRAVATPVCYGPSLVPPQAIFRGLRTKSRMDFGMALLMEEFISHCGI